MSEKKYEILSVSGFGWSGSSAVVDFLKEVEGINTFPYEFRMLKDPDGIIDLENGLVLNWQDLSSDIILHRFENYVKRLGRRTRFYYPLSYNYNELLNGNFFSIAENYINKIKQFSWSGTWPYHYHNYSWYKWFLFRVLNRLHISSLIDNDEMMYFTCPGEEFYSATKDFFNDIAGEIDVNNNSGMVVFDQLIPPYNCNRFLKYFYKAKIIIVDRDPRDVFVDASKWSYIPTNNVDNYIKWYRSQREYFKANYQISENILILHFEDIIHKYEESIGAIFEFLNLDKLAHINKRKIFNPDISVKNIGKWKATEQFGIFEKIEKELSEYCYQD